MERQAIDRAGQRPINHIRFISINQEFRDRCRTFRRVGSVPVDIRSTR
jgi:hypothetical protein